MIKEADFDTLTRQCMGKQIISTAVQGRHSNDIIARFTDGLDRISDGCHARCYCKGTDTAFERRDAFLQHGIGRVHNTGIDIACNF